MAELTRHIGRVTNTGARVVVVFRKLPEDANYCLVVESDSLPEMYHDNMMTIVKSRAAQDNVDLYPVLDRQSFGDGRKCLQALHDNALLRKVPVELVELIPYPNTPVALSVINTELDKNGANIKPSNVEEVTVTDHSQPITELPEIVQEQVIEETPELKAEGIIQRAKLMEETAAALKEEAYMLVPGMRPTKGRPKLTEDEKAAAKKKRNEKRRESYAKNTKDDK